MDTLIIYDNNGNIYVQMSGTYSVPSGGIQFLEIEVPEGKTISKIDVTVTPHSPIYENMTETLEQSMKVLKNESELLKGCVMELADIVYSSTTRSGV